jgi:hypothetical protein
MRMACPEATQIANSGQFVRLRTFLCRLQRGLEPETKWKKRPRKAHSAPPLYPSDRHTPVGSLTATKRRPCLWITKWCLGTWIMKRCLGTWNAKA